MVNKNLYVKFGLLAGALLLLSSFKYLPKNASGLLLYNELESF